MRNQLQRCLISLKCWLTHTPPFSTQHAAEAVLYAPPGHWVRIDSSASKPTRSTPMTHYGPSPVTTLGLSNDLNKITLWLHRNEVSISKEMNADDASELARRLLNEATVLRQRGMQRKVP